VPLYTFGGVDLGLAVLVLVLRIWSCLHHSQYPQGLQGAAKTSQNIFATTYPQSKLVQSVQMRGRSS